ncbi:Ig-like domain-containing protein, partial [Anaerobacillus sp. 1_MG-2023]|uniref:Ig-like domain-containing protein n=1 Tax=Anaerobacillus sp. 1_MG-2023 TaxID=3062655 RepID=UPI0026E43516
SPNEQQVSPAAAEPGEITENIITDVILKDAEGNVIDESDNPGNIQELGGQVFIQYLFKLENNHGYVDGSTFTFNLPDAFDVFNKVNGDLVFNGDTIGTFRLSMNKEVVLTFNQKIEDLSNIEGKVQFESIFSETLTGSVNQII